MLLLGVSVSFTLVVHRPFSCCLCLILRDSLPLSVVLLSIQVEGGCMDHQIGVVCACVCVRMGVGGVGVWGVRAVS